MLGGAGKDRLYGGKGDDKVYGQEGDDRIFGEDGNDRLFGDIIFFGFDLPGGRDDDDDADDDDDDERGGLSFDRIDLVEFGFDAFGDVAALFEDTSGDAVIRFDFETSITLVNVDTDALLVQTEVFILV